MKNILKYGATYLGIILLFNIILLLACSFPSEWIHKNVKESSDILLKEGGFFYSFFGWVGSIIDNNTDVLCVNEAYSIDSSNPFESYMKARKNYQKGLTEVQLPDAQGDLYSYSLNLKDSNRKSYS